MALAFSNDWAESWCRILNASDDYRTAAANWVGSVVLAVRQSADVPVAAAVLLDLEPGRCRGGRTATADDLETAAFVFEGEPNVWRELLIGAGSPIMALMTGRLRLARGEFARLLPYAGA